jgi:GNAT superfamily N-acetyltransferase
LHNILVAAAGGTFPPPDGSVDVVPPPPGADDAIVAFSFHHIVASDVECEWIASQIPPGDPAAPMRVGFISWLGHETGNTPGTIDQVFTAPDHATSPTIDLIPRDDLEGHPRVAFAAESRTDVRVWSDQTGAGVVILGRGLARRLEVSFEVEESARGRGLGRRLVAAVPTLVSGEPVFAQVSPGNVASTRAVLAAGYRPVCAEVLFTRRGHS